jgi:hypothetical protein
MEAVIAMGQQIEEGEVLAPTLRVINVLEAEGVIGRYAIGGAMGANFHTEVVQTEDLGVFCFLPLTGLIATTAPVYARLAELGYAGAGGADGDAVDIEGVPVQFLGAGHGLTTEALTEAVNKTAEGVPTRVFQYEHLLALMVETNRPKDRARITQCLESAEPDRPKLEGILRRYGLLDRWRIITE